MNRVASSLCRMLAFAAAMAAVSLSSAMAANDLVIAGGNGGAGGATNGAGEAGAAGVVMLDGITPSGANAYPGAAGGAVDGGEDGIDGAGGGGDGGDGGIGVNTGGGGGGAAGSGGTGDNGGGDGGNGANNRLAGIGGGGGGGGNAAFNNTAAGILYDGIAVTGGAGGSLGSTNINPGGGGGGGGASFTNTSDNNIVVAGSLRVHGGNGGAGSNASIGSKGGNGGDALFDGGSGSVAADTIDVESGETGLFNDHGDGGSATFTTLGALSASSIVLKKNDGGLTFIAGALDVNKDTAFSMDQGSAAGTFAVSINGLSFSNASGLTITAANGANFDNFGGNLSVTGGGNSMYNGTFSTYDTRGKTLAFVMDGSETDGGVMLDTTAGAIAVDRTTVFSLIGTTGLGLNSQVTLASVVGGDLDSSYLVDGYILGRRTLAVSQTNLSLLATVTAVKTYRDAQDSLLPASLSNVNLQNGASHLDLLDRQRGSGDSVMQKLDAAFTRATASGSAWNQRVALGQLYGEYGSYANTALSSDASRFRRRWQGRNRSFFDSGLFAEPSVAWGDSTGIASASGLASPAYGVRDAISCGLSRIWAGGFGTWARQNGRDNLPGYKYASQGAVLGYEYAIGNLNLGFAAAYSAGDLKVNDLRYKNEADVLNLALYGAYVHDSGVYAEGGFGYGHAWNDYEVHGIATPGGVKKGKYGSDVFTADFELGYIARLPRDFNLISSIGIEYTSLRNGSWTEGVNNAALVANRFASGSDNGVDIPLGLRFNKLFRFGCDGGFVIPEVRASCVYSADKSRPSITVGYAGTQGGAKMVGVDPGRSRWRIGAGLFGRVNSRVDFRVDYDFETRSGFRGHSLNASVGLAF